MLPVLVVCGLVAISEAGNQHHAGVGLNYYLSRSHVVRPALARPYGGQPVGFRPGPFAPSIVANSVLKSNSLQSHLTLPRAPLTLLHSSYRLGALSPIPTFTKISLPTVIGSVPSAPSILSNHIPPVVLNATPIRFAPVEPTNIQISPATVFNNYPSIASAPLEPAIASPHSVVSVPAIESNHKDVVPDKSISYSISDQDYAYLKHHKVEGQDSPFNPILGFNTSPDEAHRNPHSHHKEDKALLNNPTGADNVLKRSPSLIGSCHKPSLLQGNSIGSLPQRNSEGSIFQGNSEGSLIQALSEGSLQGNSEGSIFQGNSEGSLIQALSEGSLQGNSEGSIFQGNSEGSLIQALSEGSLQGNSEGSFIQSYSEPSILQVNSGSFINTPEPIVSKDIYFHVPPPDFEEPPRVPIANLPRPKKNYNIVFIKAPSQESQNNAYLQQLIQQSRQSQIEDKTLIYVLSKNQEPPQQKVLPPQQTSVSSPEVYFVKYKTRLGDVTDINEQRGGIIDIRDQQGGILDIHDQQGGIINPNGQRGGIIDINSNNHVEETIVEEFSSILERKRRLGDNRSESSSKKSS